MSEHQTVKCQECSAIGVGERHVLIEAGWIEIRPGVYVCLNHKEGTDDLYPEKHTWTQLNPTPSDEPEYNGTD